MSSAQIGTKKHQPSKRHPRLNPGKTRNEPLIPGMKLRLRYQIRLLARTFQGEGIGDRLEITSELRTESENNAIGWELVWTETDTWAGDIDR